MLLRESNIFDKENTGWRILVSNQEGVVVSQSAKLVPLCKEDNTFLQRRDMNCLLIAQSNKGFSLQEVRVEDNYFFSQEMIQEADILFIDPETALKLNPDFSKKEELHRLVQVMKKTMLAQLCFILQEYAKWLNVKIEASSLSHLFRTTYVNAWNYIDALEDNREDMEEWIEDTVQKILA